MASLATEHPSEMVSMALSLQQVVAVPIAHCRDDLRWAVGRAALWVLC